MDSISHVYRKVYNFLKILSEEIDVLTKTVLFLILLDSLF